MKSALLILFFAFCYIECRKIYKPIDKNANLDFINMESGGVRPGGNARPVVQPLAPGPVQPAPLNPKSPPAQAPKPVSPTPPAPTAAKPVQPAQPAQIKPVPVNPTPAVNPITTPGPGSVKHLINFYDSQGKGSPIRPYSYSQAVKQG